MVGSSATSWHRPSSDRPKACSRHRTAGDGPVARHVQGAPINERNRIRESAPTIIFVGSWVVFSDRLLRLVEAEFHDLSVMRLRSLDDIGRLDQRARGLIELVVVDEGHAEALGAILAGTAPSHAATRWVLAYRAPETARRLMRRAETGSGSGEAGSAFCR